MDIGDVVTYVDEHGREFNALVVGAAPPEGEGTFQRHSLAHVEHEGIGIVFRHEILHRADQITHGNYWREP